MCSEFQNSMAQHKASMMSSWDWGVHPNPGIILENDFSVLASQPLSSYRNRSVQIAEENYSESHSRRLVSGFQPIPRDNSLHFLESREKRQAFSGKRNSSISCMSSSRSENQVQCILDTQVNLVELLQTNPTFMKIREMTGKL